MSTQILSNEEYTFCWHDFKLALHFTDLIKLSFDAKKALGHTEQPPKSVWSWSVLSTTWVNTESYRNWVEVAGLSTDLAVVKYRASIVWEFGSLSSATKVKQNPSKVHLETKIIYPKYSKYCLSTVAHTIDCVRNKILTHHSAYR